MEIAVIIVSLVVVGLFVWFFAFSKKTKDYDTILKEVGV